MKTILILGAGMGGIVTARELSKHSGNEEDINLVKILVFEKKESSLLSSSLPWVMVGQRKKSEITNRKYSNVDHLSVIFKRLSN